ncbi:MAG TPA: chemotaxis-specific protein-glutamate methyltransferase CheB, partial [Thermoguttaceae bacterium]|nr:chemotaxis-specific protein-glutamate methyltransferase CheB [Thermoguttaceae bacterium]
LHPDLLTLDLEMPEIDGLELLRRLKQSGSQVGAIMLSGASEHGAKTTMAALELGAFDFVAKPTKGTAEENFVTLQQDLRPKVEAFARTRNVHDILHGHGPPPPAGLTPLPSTDNNDVASRMGRIVANTSGRAEIVAIGISTGGPQALNHMLPQLPADLPAAVLIVQHMPPLFTKSLADDLNRRCALTVSEAVDGQPVVPGHVLIAPGGKQMKIVKEDRQPTICITDDPPENSCRPSADYLFRSVTRTCGPNAVGVIMTGMGNDGARGCRQMKQRGAKIIAQDEASCVVFGMPREPIEEGIADVIAPLDEIAAEIVRMVGQGAAVCR